MRVQCWRRISANSDQWEAEIYGEGDRIFLQSIKLKIEVKDLYRGVNLTA